MRSMKCMSEFIYCFNETLGWQSDKSSCNVTCSLNMQATMDSSREMTLFITIMICFRFKTVSAC